MVHRGVRTTPSPCSVNLMTRPGSRACANTLDRRKASRAPAQVRVGGPPRGLHVVLPPARRYVKPGMFVDPASAPAPPAGAKFAVPDYSPVLSVRA